MRFAAFLAPVLVAGCAHSPSGPATMEDARSLAAAESAFAAHSVREDMRVAFIAHFAADGVFVRNGWVVARESLASRQAPPIVLDWKPVYAEVAASGEMGLSTGPWKITSRTDPKEPPAYGQFVSIWKREAGGAWQVAVDLGIDNPESTFWDAPLEAAVVPAGGPSRGSLEATERAFEEMAARQGARAAYARFSSERVRFYRGGAAPSLGRQAALASPLMKDDKLSWTIERSETARSGDFGYARGSYSGADATQPAGWFMRAWRVEAGEWRIALDVVNPAK
jgi:ketosteroid isomerase-like protein